MKRIFPSFYNFFSSYYWFGEVDSRPLAVFRICLAALLFKDALFHLPLAYWFYSNEGIFSLDTLNMVARPFRFSLMDALPYTWMAQLFFGLWALVTLLLLMGYRTRLMAIINFVMLLSVHERNIYVLSGADTTLRVMSFWAMFLPMGQYYAVDAVRARWSRYARTHRLEDLRVTDAPQTAFAFPVRIAQVQVGIIYFFTFILKLPGGIWQRGEALFYAFQLKTLTLPTADWLHQYAPSWVLTIGSYFALAVESAFVPLVFSPIGQPILRMIGLGLGLMLHVGIAVTMAIQDFSLIMMISYFTLWEARWIVWVDHRLRGKPTMLTIRQPEPNSPLWLLLAVTREDEICVETALSSEDALVPPLSYDAWQVSDIASGKAYSGVAAWQCVAAHLPLSRLWSWVLRFEWVRRLLWWSLERFSQREALPMPSPTKRLQTAAARRHWLGRLILFASLSTMMVSILWWNTMNVEIDEIGNRPLMQPIPRDLEQLIWYTGMWQHWGMFSPYPSLVDGWIEIPGRFEDAIMFDLRTGERPLLELPRYYWGPVARWKKFEENINRERSQTLLAAWAVYYCDLYNNDMLLPYGYRLATLDIVWRYRDSYAPGASAQPYREVVLWHHWCFDEYAPTSQ